MFCTKCGARLIEDDQFWAQCGAAANPHGSATLPNARAPQHQATGARGDSGAAQGLTVGFAIGLLLLIAFGLWIWRDYQRREPSDHAQHAVNTASGGLGLTETEWRAVHGDPVDTQFGDALDRYPGDGDYHVDIRPLMNDTSRMTHIVVSFDSPVPLDEAETVVSTYLPDDVEVVAEFRHEIADRPVVLYHSDWLAKVGPPAGSPWWSDARPGSFAVTYGWPSNNRPSGPVASATITLGHRP